MSHSNTMTLHVIHDRGGRILAAAAVPDSVSEREIPTPLPVAGSGQRLARISMPYLQAAEVSALLERHRVKGTGAKAALVASSKSRPRTRKAPARKK